jgi:hypothetical protein
MLLALAMLLVLLVAGSVPAAAGGATVPFKAFYLVHPTVVGVDQYGCRLQQFPGEGEATHLGESLFYADAKSCPNGVQTGVGTWTAANGDQLFGGLEGIGYMIMIDGVLTAVFEGTYYMDGGTGRFEGYTGSGDYWGTAIPLVSGELYFEGTLTKP